MAKRKNEHTVRADTPDGIRKAVDTLRTEFGSDLTVQVGRYTVSPNDNSLLTDERLKPLGAVSITPVFSPAKEQL